MFFTANQLLAHLIGDYIIQFDSQAVTKKEPTLKGATACASHAITYALPFLYLTTSWKALLFIIVTHFLIDHSQFVAKFIWWKNNMFKTNYEFKDSICGFANTRPQYLAVWLCIIIDNILHLVLNAIAINAL